MKKRFAVTAIIICILMLLCACASGASATPSQTVEIQPTPAPTVQETKPAQTQESEPVIISEEPSPPLQIDDTIKAMLPVMDSGIRAMIETDSAYAPDDDIFIWTTLYLAAVNFGEQLQIAEVKDSYVQVSRQAIQEIAAACFEDYSDLPEIPDALSEAVSYNKKQDAYAFILSDIGDSSTDVVDVEADGDVTKVWVEFNSWDETQSFVFTLVHNPYADSISEPVFQYSVRLVEKAE